MPSGFRTWGCAGVASDDVFVTRRIGNEHVGPESHGKADGLRDLGRFTSALKLPVPVVAAKQGGVSGFLGCGPCGIFRILDHGP